MVVAFSSKEGKDSIVIVMVGEEVDVEDMVVGVVVVGVVESSKVCRSRKGCMKATALVRL